MRQWTYTITATAGGRTYTPAIVLDHHVTPFNVGIGVAYTGAASANYTVQHTFSDPFTQDLSASAGAGTWINHEFLTSATTSDDGNYAYPVRAIRVFITSAVSANCVVNVIQAGP